MRSYIRAHWELQFLQIKTGLHYTVNFSVVSLHCQNKTPTKSPGNRSKLGRYDYQQWEISADILTLVIQHVVDHYLWYHTTL